MKWQKQYRDPFIGGLLVGELGASKYILNHSRSAEPITKGYHRFWLDNGTLMGQLGATVEIVEYNDSGIKP